MNNQITLFMKKKPVLNISVKIALKILAQNFLKTTTPKRL